MASFADALKMFAEDTEAKAHELVREVVLETGRRVIDRSPAPEKGNPYSTGQLISNWNYSLESPDRGVSKRLDIRTVNYLEDLPQKAAGFVHYITNAVAHGYYVEVGTSQMSPQPMVGPTQLEFDQIVDGAVLKV